MPRVAGWALTALFVLCGWVLFRSPDFATASRLFAGMAGAAGVGRAHVDNALVVAAAIVIALAMPTSQALALERLRPARWLMLPAAAGLVFLLLLVGGRLPNEFIYFQF